MNLVQYLQAAVGPVILISGVGLLLLSITNRYGRIIDRSRNLAEAFRKTPEAERARFIPQLHVLLRRAALARAAITLATLSILMVAVLVIVLFVSGFFHLELAQLVVGLFIAGMATLIASLVFLLWEVNLSLAALKLEVTSLDKEILKTTEKSGGNHISDVTSML